MTDMQKIMLLSIALMTILLFIGINADANELKEHAQQVKSDRLIKYECIRSNQNKGE